MTPKRFALAWGAATLALFLQPLTHGVILGDFYVSEIGQPESEPNIVLLAMFLLLYPGLMTYLYHLAYRGGSPLLEGGRLGAIVGLFFVLPLNLVHTTQLGASMMLVLVDTPIHIVLQGLMGVAIGLTAGRFREGSESSGPSD